MHLLIKRKKLLVQLDKDCIGDQNILCQRSVNFWKVRFYFYFILILLSCFNRAIVELHLS